MKRKTNVIIALIFCLIVVFFSHPEYEIVYDRNTITSTSKEVEIEAIVPSFWDSDKIVQDIITMHAKINGMSDSITINLYLNRFCRKNGYKYKTVETVFTDSSPQNSLL